jgi:putative transposase
MLSRAMPRVARIVVPGVPHHVTQRGNNRQDVFFVDDDRRVYLKILAAQCRRYGVTMLAYCLMTNHVHLVPVPGRADALAKAIGRTHWLYSQYVNRMHGRSGHLWQNRFYSCPLGDEEHALLAVRYAERNPLRVGLCRVARRYRWSSAAAHCDGAEDELGLLDLKSWKQLAAGLNWERELALPMSEREIAGVRRATHTGRPLASDKFLSKLEHALGRRLRALPPGRPKQTNRRSKAKRARRSRADRAKNR